MTFAVFLIVYAVVWLFAWFAIARYQVAEFTKGSTPTTDDYITAVVISFLAALFWPLFIPGIWIYKQLRKGHE